MSLFTARVLTAAGLLHRHVHRRNFIAARIKWVRDPYLDNVVQREKDLKSVISLKNLIFSQPSKFLPISVASLEKDRLGLPTTVVKFIEYYPSVFSEFRPEKPLSLPHLKLTRQALAIHREETRLSNSQEQLKEAAERLAKFLMLAGAGRVPFVIIDRFRYDLGLPLNYVLNLLPDYPDYFQMCSIRCNNGCEMLGLELVSWKNELAVSVMQKKEMDNNVGNRRIPFLMELPRGFDLEKKVMNWVHQFQRLPYISPYENAFHLPPKSDQAEKWAVGIVHELLHLLVSKKTERENLYSLGDYLGFGMRFKNALVHHPGIFYVSNKNSTQTVVLREAFRKDFLILKNPLMGIRHRYIHLMNKQPPNLRRKLIPFESSRRMNRVLLASKHGLV
ncbi:protein WHAT'S THIS FACTOR 9, mitochondrial [Impatiens glandulifera]|uniref:protein WHAT'S THIS FACTOR 9, mitochondrial n=1 Tax=Impatiens glandulifera TaxID=253017 RepID=UPI001FB089C7|nr:protein WHAT'S THIS FACTOR 9, mitochondrial [Impatiens glandulifera]